MTAAALQKEIQRQMASSSLIDGQIDSHQEKVVQLLKQTIVEKHYYVQRLFIVENYYEKKFDDHSSLLKEKVFHSEDKKVFDNFAALDLPTDFSKGPMKAFLNTLLDSLESFLPAFYFLTPSKLPSGNFFASPADVLVRCVFPTLFGYCWATEPATAYAENLVRWFGELYQTKTDFIAKFRTEWMFNAMYGFFTSLDFQAFIVSAIRPVFFEYVQATATQQKDVGLIFSLASRLLYNVVNFYHLLPAVLNVLFNLLHDELKKLSGGDEKKAENEFHTMVKYLFFEGILENFVKYPLLFISDLPIPESDFAHFSDVINVFKIKLGSETDIDQAFINQITALELFKEFEPMIILEKIESNAATGALPSLQEFCNIVQCAHQPLLMSTHHLSLLFRFVASLQHLAHLPQAIDRSIDLVFTNSLTDKLEVLDDQFFWFPCFSLKYMNIKSTSFERQMPLSPIYRLLSNYDLHLKQTEPDFAKALKDAETTTNLTTHPEIRTEIHWLVFCNEDLNALIAPLREEIQTKEKEIHSHRTRANNLNTYARTLEAMIDGIPAKNPKMALGLALASSFEELKQRNFIEQGFEKIKEFCGGANETVGPYIIEALIMKLSPNVKTSDITVSIYSNDVEGSLQRLVRPPIVTSSLVPDAIRLAQDCITILKYSSYLHIENSLARCFQPPFMESPRTLAQNLSNCLSFFPREMLSCVFTGEEYAALSAFFASFP